MDFNKLKKLSYMSKRMFVIENICKKRSTGVEYLFGLLNLYNKNNSGRWFWQKAAFTGPLKSAYDNFNKTVDDIVKAIKKIDEAGFPALIEEAAEPLDKLLAGLEMNCGVNRDNDFEYVKGFLDDNLQGLINDSLKPFRNQQSAKRSFFFSGLKYFGISSIVFKKNISHI
ncbi:MAG: hypothetical protein K8S14_02705 [Actinomycetia bacterium]|nr:hypothetical protein [Actinomycetes bacterium]